MKKQISISLALLLPALLGSSMASANAFSANARGSYFRYAPKAKAPDALFASQAKAVAKKTTATTAQNVLTENNDVTWLDAPDGSTWFCTTVYDSEEVPVPGGYGQTETYLKGFEYTIYDSDFNLIGTVKDKIELAEGENRVRAIELSSILTKKFFNSNDKYEIIVGTACNAENNSMNYRSYAYTIGGEKDSEGYDVPLTVLDGYVTVGFNNAADKWSENFYIGFITEYSDPEIDDRLEYLNSFKDVVTFYKKAGWGSAPSEYGRMEVKMVSLPGDQEATPFMVPFVHDGKYELALSYYEKPYFIDPAPIDYDEVLTPTDDNNLVIEIYQTGSAGFEMIQQTKIPVEHNADEHVASFYGIGAFRYDGDINYGDIDPSQPSKAAFMVTRQCLAGFNDAYEYSLLHYDADGNALRTIAEGMENYVNLSDIKGFEPQCMFISTITGDDYIFDIVDLYSGNTVATLPHFVDGAPLTANMDRVRVGDSYQWVFACGNNRTDLDRNTIENVLWLDTTGKLVRIDELNIGQRVAYAEVYINNEALDPYLFNTDAAQEYMYLVKRYDESGLATIEDLLVVSSYGNTLMTLQPDETRGILQSIMLFDPETKPRMGVIYRNTNSNLYTQEFYDLPLMRFAGGDGSEANPYLIATVGDLKQIQSEPDAHYRLLNDIDAAGYELNTSGNTFSGTFDGDSKFIKNLTIASNDSYLSLFGSLSQDAEIKNVNFVNTRLEFLNDATQAGLIAVNAKGAAIDNVHVYGLSIVAPEDSYPLIGGLVGQATNYASISNSSVSNAVLVSPEGEVGGIVGDMLTGSTVRACSFTGSIRGNANVGGIAGEVFAAESAVTDCHVNADIVANNTVGGITGSSKRATIANCHVEGSVEALAAPRWYDYGPCAGGIVGELLPDYGSAEGQAMAAAEESVVACIRGNYVNLSSLKGFESTAEAQWDGQYSTMHRIVGRTVANYDPSEVDDASTAVETGLSDNYAHAGLAAVSADADAAGVEGATADDDSLDAEFFTGLGFRYGNTADAPWQEQPEWRPTLYHELSALALPAEIEAKVGRKFNATVMFISRVPMTEDEVLSGLTCDTDDSLLQMTGNYSYADNTLSVEFEALAEGEAEIKISTAGATAAVKVNILPASGTGNISAPGSDITISFDGSVISAASCRLNLFNISGLLVDTGEDSVSTNGLAAGVYIVRATDNNGNTATAKIAVK